MTQALLAVLARDFTVYARRASDLLTPLMFFGIVVALFPLAVGPETAQLRAMAPGVIWVAALLAAMLGLAPLFANDYRDGTLEQMLLAPQPLSALVFAKVLGHWLATGLPLTLIAPLLALQLQLPAHAMGTLVASLLLGTPILSLLGAVAAALTLGVRASGVLVSLLVLPLYTPVLIFGAEAVVAAANGASAEAQLSLLGALLVLAIAFVPWAAASALRVSLD